MHLNKILVSLRQVEIIVRISRQAFSLALALGQSWAIIDPPCSLHLQQLPDRELRLISSFARPREP
jgi:hypothetical protein